MIVGNGFRALPPHLQRAVAKRNSFRLRRAMPGTAASRALLRIRAEWTRTRPVRDSLPAGPQGVTPLDRSGVMN